MEHERSKQKETLVPGLDMGPNPALATVPEAVTEGRELETNEITKGTTTALQWLL